MADPKKLEQIGNSMKDFFSNSDFVFNNPSRNTKKLKRRFLFIILI